MQRKASWVQSYPCTESVEAEIRQALITHGVEVEANTTGLHGVVCFATVSEGLLAVLHEARRDSRRRILAVAVSPQQIETPVVWRLIHAGADDVLFWRDDGIWATQLIAKLERWFEVDELAAEVISEQSLIGDSPEWQVLIRKVVEAARFSAVPVLLTGESGTGKELLARLISVVHAGTGGGRKHPRNELITVDCASLVPELSGSEFFGHERGAFTDAHVQREGAFALADGATLFLDEIGEVPLGLQPQLLRAIQERTYKRVGGNVWYKTNCRLVCATNRNLQDAVQRGQFRLDLYYRIAGFVFQTPALRYRKEDILPLARYFLGKALSGEAPELEPAVKEYLLNRLYPGNVRELRQLVERVAHRYVGPGSVTAGDIPEDDRPTDGEIHRSWPDEQLEKSISDALALGTTLKEITRIAADTAIRIAVCEEDNNLQRAASKLGVTDRTLQMWRATHRLREPA